MDLVIFYGILLFIVGAAIYLFIKADAIKMKNPKLSFFLLSLALNSIALPLSLFIGGMATDAPDSNNLDFLRGFLFVQAIPLIMLFISIFKLSSKKYYK